MSASGLRPANKKHSSKEENLVKAFFRKSATFLDDKSRVTSISAP